MKCGVLTGLLAAALLCPAQSSPVTPEQTLSAVPFRGQTVRLSAWLRVAATDASVRLWMRADGAVQSSDSPVNSTAWTRSEITLKVPPGADMLSFGVLPTGSAAFFTNEIALVAIPVPEVTQLPAEPANLKSPAGWDMLQSTDDAHTAFKAGYQARTSSTGCRLDPPCALLTSPASVRPGSWGSLLQSFSAARYRGRTVRLRASLHLQGAGREDYARVWLRTARRGEGADAESVPEHMDYREVRGGDWSPVEIVRKIDDDIEDLSIGMMLLGKGRVMIGEVSFTVLPVPANAGVRQTTLAEINWPALPGPSHQEQGQIINAASAHSLRYIRDLPNFFCNLRIDRSENRNDRGWRERDTLGVQLGFSERREHYKLTTVNGRPTSAPYRSVGGALSEGDFGSVMAEIFRPRTAQFHWDHWTRLRGHIAHVFRYEVALPQSAYVLEFVGTKGKPRTAVTAHHGYVFIENGTDNILRIEQIADPAAGFPLRYTSNAVDYDWSDVGGVRYLLPLSSEITMGSLTVRSQNLVQFHDYRKFTAESQIRFDQQGDQPGAQP